MFEAGVVVGIALLASLAKMSWTWKLRVLSHPLMIDVFIFVGLVMLHWGTFSGVMVATIGAFVCSTILSVGRWLYGYTEQGKYVPGKFHMEHKLKKT
jgi:hypothetical protein